MAGVTNIGKAPYPTGDQGIGGCVTVRMGGHVPNGLTAFVLDCFLVPWDCYIRGVDLCYTKIDTDLDAMTLTIVDDTKTIVTSQDGSADIAGVAQSLHSDVANDAYVVQGGDVIKATADSTTGNEEGMVFWTLHLKPVYA